MNRWILEPEDVAKLRERLRPVVGADALDHAIAGIDAAAYFCKSSTLNLKNMKSLMEQEQRHSLAVSQAAAELRSLLATGRPMWNAGGLDWPTFDAMLVTIEESARTEAAARAPKRKRGQPAHHHRDNLIAFIAHVYGKKRETRFSHMADTVADVLGYIDANRSNVPALVKQVLKRRRSTPFFVIGDGIILE